MYLGVKDPGNYHLLVICAEHPMRVIVNGSRLLFRMVGPSINVKLMFLADPHPESLVRRLHRHYMFGRAHLPPFWAMGYHQCRWGYRNADKLLKVIEQFDKAQLPIDTIWTDLDYMSMKNDFTIDEYSFPLDKMAKVLETVRWVPLIDAGVGEISTAYREGEKLDLFVQSAVTNATLKAEVWPGTAYFVDFLHPKAKQFWKDQLL
jgi:alpha-glucosidase (family GH31 glycosyl hydrolase)